MTTRRGLRARLGVGTGLVILAILGVPAASAAPESLEWSPPAYDYGPVAYGAGPSQPHEFTLTNTGESQVVIHNWRYRYVEAWPESGDPFGSPASTTSPCGHSLEPGESCSIEVVFAPRHPGNWQSWVRVRGEIEEPWAELALSGEGVGPWVPITPDTLMFESIAVGTTTARRTVTVEDQDPNELRIEDISTTPVGSWPLTSTPFEVVGGTCREGQSIEPGKTCTIEVVMAPAMAGLLRSTLEITDSAPDSPQFVDLEGTATAAAGGSQPPAPDGGIAGITPPPIPSPPPHTKRPCPKGKRTVVRRSGKVCLRKRNHHRRH